MTDVMTVVAVAALIVLGLGSASPLAAKRNNRDIQNRTKGWTDLFLPYPEYPVRRRECTYKGAEYPDGAMVDTSESCLKCRCLSGSLVCYLRVCPALPDPPPPHCVLVLRRGACCSELICEEGGVSTNHISRSEPIGSELPMGTISYEDGKGCIDNGTLYGSGSAMSTSSLCEYCYCISGEQRCIKPRCLLPLSGCRPHRSPHSCCPVRYDCEHQLTTTTLAPSQVKGCNINGIMFPEGERVESATQSPCDNCFCMRGTIRCVPLSCAPPLLGCTPIVEPGKCCASSYNCSAKIPIKHKISAVPDNSLRRIEPDIIINERSFPDDTLLSPSQIAALLLNTDGRINRRIGIENATIGPLNTSKGNSSTKINQNDEGENKNTSTTKFTVDLTTPKTLIENNTVPTVLSMESKASINVTEPIKKQKNNTTEMNNKNETNNQLDVSNKNNESNEPDKNSTVSDVTTESIVDVTQMILNDTVNCTSEVSQIDTTDKTTEFQLNDDVSITDSKFNDTEERHPYISGSIDAITDSNSGPGKEKNQDNDISSIVSQFPSTSLIIPKDNDVFMVNVSTFVRTNTSVVTLRPVAAIPPHIEALLNMTINKNNPKDDYFDYDYKSSLPPSLPNLEIIPFLAIDAVDKVKDQNRYGTAYPQVESKNYIANDNFNPTTYFPNEEKYIANPTTYSMHSNNFHRNPVYKQHINDKFQATTYATIVDDKYENHQYAQDKYDATVYPLLTSEDTQTELPSYGFDVSQMNHFSPPTKTEGGFLPRDPPLNSYYDIEYPTSEDMSATESSLMVTDHAKTNSDDCLSNGRKYKNGELITETSACVVCFCYYGDIHCQDPECPPIKKGCRRIINKGTHSCCGTEICGGESTTIKPTMTSSGDNIVNITKTTVNLRDKVSSENQSKDIVRTEISNLDLSPHFVRNTTITTSTTQEPTFAKIPTYVIPSKTTKKPTTSPSPTTTEISTVDPITTNVFSFENLFRNKIEQQTTTEITPRSPSTTNPPIETTINEMEPYSEEEEEEEFSFGSVLKLLLGDSSEVTTRAPIRTTKRYTTTTQGSSSWRPSTLLSTRLETTTQTTTIKTTTAIPTTPSTVRSTQKYFTKPTRATSSVNLLYKNYTKPIATTRPPLVYPTVNRFTKPRYPFSSTSLPLSTEFVKKIASPVLPVKDQSTGYKRKPTGNVQTESAYPFGAGLLKLAGCNIYGRMYRVGKLITELSGPCLECMCTEIGVQCRAIPC